MDKICVIDAGGGFRGIYAAAVLDRCLDDDVEFDLGIGVSAGSANIASFLSGQKGRNYRFYTEYGKRKEYASLKNFLSKGSYIDMDYVYGSLSNSDGEDPMDYYEFIGNPMDFIVVATNAETAEPVYINKLDIERDSYDAFKASSAIPGLCKPYEVNGIPCFDGALADPVPVQLALDNGCDKVILLLTKPKDLPRDSKSDAKIAKSIRRKYPKAADALCKRAERYNAGVALAKQLEAEGRALIVAPDDTCGVTTLTRDRNALDALYEKGYGDGGAILDYLDGIPDLEENGS